MDWVYLLQGTTGRFYLGSSDDLDRRLAQHNAGKVHTTKRLGLPVRLVAARCTPTLKDARSLELKLKRWKNPAKVMAFLRDGSG